MKIASICAALTIAFCACGEAALETTPTPHAMRRPVCDDTPPFETTFFPTVLRDTQVRSDSTPDGIEFTYEAQGTRIDIRRGAAYFPAEDPTPLRVAGVTGQFGKIDGGYSVNFQIGPDRCDRYEITTSGVSSQDVVRFAEGLRLRD